jgi:hypothetical protein
MSNYPQDKFSAPDISGKWKFYTNVQFITLDGISKIEKLTGEIEINQDNLFYNLVNKESNLIRIGTFVQNITCINGKTNIEWQGRSINNTDSATWTLTPYCYKNGKPTKMTSTNISPGPLDSNNLVYVRNSYYEKI